MAARRPVAQQEPARLLPLPMDEEWWQRLPDILQAQVAVALETRARRTRRKTEQLLWIGTPYLRTRSILCLFLLWTILLVLPVLLLVELVEHGGWIALGWSIVSVFIFVPQISRGSREVYVLTNERAFTSTRTMHCSITTDQLDYGDVTSARVIHNKDFTGTIELKTTLPEPNKHPNNPYNPPRYVILDKLRNLQDACRVLQDQLPREITIAGIDR